MQLNYERLTEERQRYCCDIEGRERETDRQTDRETDRQTDRGGGGRNRQIER